MLEQKELLTKQEINTLTKSLKRQNPPGGPTDPLQQHFTAQENAVIEQIMEVIEQNGFPADHAKTLLVRTIQLLEWGKQTAQELPEGNALIGFYNLMFPLFNRF